ncbi:outer membrane beta-barrel protein [Ferruginibacter sp. SUN106]|uniref:type IX secretion/gliding motility protein PorT/SprT n=1 Tax=Ferruginibacter sp. SUN106 TaxID=2978348 RepID=UPI003D35A948
MQHLLRYKIAFVLSAFLCCPLLGISQLRDGINLPDHDEKEFHFGINLGLNRSHFSFTHHPIFMQRDSVMVVESINSTGLNLAWLVDKRLSEHFNLRTFPLDLTFTEKAFEYNLKYPDRPGGEDSITIKKVQSISLTFPLQLKFSSDRIGNFKVYMMGGGKVEFDMAANAGAKKAENLIKLNRLDYGIEAGLGFHFYYPYFVLTPEVKIGWGLGNLHARDKDLKFSNVIDKINSRTITFSLTVE